MRVAGVMSGTSLDGIDVAIVDIVRGKVTTVAHSTTPYAAALKKRILNLSGPQSLSRLNFELGGLYADAVAAMKIPVELVGCHGQTVYHEGGRNTLQIGEAAVIAERLNVPVVSDFRPRDIAAGGQGAPLVPFVDDLLLRSNKVNRVALNIGGIANITVLHRGQPVTAFDTGPGNMVIDQLAGGVDKNGRRAARGNINQPLLKRLLADRYYSAKPPKSVGREQYGAAFIERLLKTKLPADDLIATATALTAITIAQAVPAGTQELIAAGGGVHNPQIMAQLAAYLPGCRVTTTDEFGIDPDAKEAVAFAVLAHRTIQRRTSNVPSATGARHPVVLGKITC